MPCVEPCLQTLSIPILVGVVLPNVLMVQVSNLQSKAIKLEDSVISPLFESGQTEKKLFADDVGRFVLLGDGIAQTLTTSVLGVDSCRLP